MSDTENKNSNNKKLILFVDDDNNVLIKHKNAWEEAYKEILNKDKVDDNINVKTYLLSLDKDDDGNCKKITTLLNEIKGYFPGYKTVELCLDYFIEKGSPDDGLKSMPVIKNLMEDSVLKEKVDKNELIITVYSKYTQIDNSCIVDDKDNSDIKKLLSESKFYALYSPFSTQKNSVNDFITDGYSRGIISLRLPVSKYIKDYTEDKNELNNLYKNGINGDTKYNNYWGLIFLRLLYPDITLKTE